MKLLFSPAVYLMHRLRLMPKFAFVSLIFIAPLLLAITFLIQEMNKSIEFAQQERHGVQVIQQVHELIRLSQSHRALHHMALSGNKSASAKALLKQSEIAAAIERIEGAHKAHPVPGTAQALAGIKQAWAVLQSKLPALKGQDSDAALNAVIDQLYKLNTQIADRSNLTLDPKVETYYLIGTFVKSFPELAEGLSDLAGRGAAYIDTGLMAPEEDILLNSTVMLARRDLARIPVQLEAMYRENPTLQSALQTQMAAIPTASTFLDQAKNQVLNASNDATGGAFFDAGFKAVDGMYGFAGATARLLDSALQNRISVYQQRRNWMVAGVLLALLGAAYFLAGFYFSFSSEVRQLQAAVGLAASGDFRHRIASTGRDEIAQLSNAFGAMTEGLALLVSGVRSGTETIAVASREIASGNADLSVRTEEQAGSLSETASTMEHFALSVTHNADSAQRANGLVLAASQVAIRGNVALAQAVTSMDALTASAGKIGDIIGVIDTIAFQTNILALNAAVEAARAGDHGRGFAVVAAEVRNLAQRSALAAKEIKLLITDSVANANAGSKQVSDAGITMSEIVKSINQVSDVMGQIAAASAAQRISIGQVNQAVGQMDDITQQNAALVEQAAAAADSMQMQADNLSRAVAVFKLADDARGSRVAGQSMPAVCTSPMHNNVRTLPARIVLAQNAGRQVLSKRSASA